MSKQENSNELSPPQEIDLVDLVAVLWRRKSTIVIVFLISMFFAFAVYVQRVSNYYVVSAAVLIGESVRILDDGSVLSEQHMTVGESRQFLKQVLLPKEVTKLIATDTITTDSIDSSEITINTEEGEGEASKFLVISATTSPEYIDEMKAIIDG
ncbi:MAG: Wzz/FepE/Etk N-terminal domain-containing protein, partial [Phycisphaerales bacterium]|nr:Wzz/FepE/Etk N-terminal domain-containing protein [Phycisphaerales bacterium]